MLGKIRKFSSSIFAKVFLIIIAIPFIFWGMGPIFKGGKLNTIAEINNEKIHIEDFVNFLEYASNNIDNNNLDKDTLVEKLLYDFIRQEVIFLQVEELGIKLSKNSLAKIIKNESSFLKNNKFSRTEYEKFLVKNQLNAVSFERNLSQQLSKEIFYDLIRGGLVPTDFLINQNYNKINQERNIQYIELNNVFYKNLNFTQDELQTYFDNNKEAFTNTYKSLKFLKLNPKNLVGSEEFNDLFFKKIDEIDDFIIQGKNIDFLIEHYNLNNFSETTIDNQGKNKNGLILKGIPAEIVLKNFDTSDQEPISLLEHKDDFYIIEFTKTEKVEKKVSEDKVKKEIISNLKSEIVRKEISKIINQINNNNFKEQDFYKFAKDNATQIKKTKINNINDNNNLKEDIVRQIYKYPKNRVIIAADIGLSESYLIYIEKVKNKIIASDDEKYEDFFNLSKTRMSDDIVNTYLSYLSKKYDININYKALERVKNSLR